MVKQESRKGRRRSGRADTGAKQRTALHGGLQEETSSAADRHAHEQHIAEGGSD